LSSRRFLLGNNSFQEGSNDEVAIGSRGAGLCWKLAGFVCVRSSGKYKYRKYEREHGYASSGSKPDCQSRADSW